MIMKTVQEITDNYDTHIEVVSVLKLNKRERAKFAKNLNRTGEYVELPFCGMELTTKPDLLETGLVTLSHWTDKDSWYTNDETEISTLESMLSDDISAVKRMVS